MQPWRIAFASRCLVSLAVVVSLAAAVVLGASTSSRADAEPKRVLMLHSFGLRFKPWTDYAQLIRSEINRRAQRPIDFDDQSLLNARLADNTSDVPFVDYLHALYTEKPDLILAFGAPAANFVQRYRQRLFPGVPMLLTAVEQRRVKHDMLTENDTVVSTANDVPAAFENILRVLPRTKTIAIVSGASPNEGFWQGELRRELAPLAGRVELKWYNRLSFEDILRDAAKLPPDSAIFWHTLNVDAAGVAHETNSALSRLAAAANAPIFSYLGGFFGDGIVGGPMHSVEEGSTVAAAVAVRILDGEKAGNIKTPPTTFASPKFDWRQMQRWGISESDLPPGSAVLFKPPTMWDTYRSQIVTFSGVILLQAVFIALLLHERRRRHSAEADSRQRMVELAHVNRFSTAGEMAASIAHEINQPLGAILNNVESAKIILEAVPPNFHEVKEIVGDIERDNRRAGEVIRRLRSYVTKAPFEKKDFDLNNLVAETVSFLAPQARSRQVVLRSKLTQARLRINGDPIQLQQVLSNLILNAVDAASDSTLADRTVTVATRHGDLAEVSVSDTGRGVSEEVAKKIFDPFFSTKEHGMGMGLSIVRTIVVTHGGKIDFENRNGANGAVFRVRLPLAMTETATRVTAGSRPTP